MMRSLVAALAVVVVGCGNGNDSAETADTAVSEAHAQSTIRAIYSAQITWSVNCDFYYAASVSDLANAPDPVLTPEFTGSDQVERSGYRIWIDATRDPDAPACAHLPAGRMTKSFLIRAEPMGGAGARFFAMTADGNLFQASHSIQFADGKPIGEVALVP